MKIASAPNKERLLPLINQYYYTENCIITDDNKIFNTKLNKEVGYVKETKRKVEAYAGKL